jgi:ActR/RegA family two-component response regulator
VTAKSERVEQPKILVVDDNEQVRASLEKVSEVGQFQITTAANVGEALHLIEAEPFDVLLSALRMTEEGDGFTAVVALHGKNPDALSLVYTGYPELKHALDTILLHYEVLVKPIGIVPLFKKIQESLENSETRPATNMQSVADILERDIFVTIVDWLDRVERDGDLTRVSLSKECRTGRLPGLIKDLANRLRSPQEQGSARAASEAAVEHGKLRFAQGYSLSMLVAESRILHVCIFKTLYNSLSPEDFRAVLWDANAITEECDAQLKQTLASFTRRTVMTAA